MVWADTNVSPDVPPKSYTPAEILLSFGSKKSVDKEYKDPEIVHALVPHSASNQPSSKGVNLSELLTGNKVKPKNFMVTLKIPKKTSHLVTLKFKNSSAFSNAVSKPKIHAKSSSHPFFKEVFQRMNIAKPDLRNQTGSIVPQKASYALPKPNKSHFKVRNLSPSEMLRLKSLYDTHHSIGIPLKTVTLTPNLSFTGIDFLLFYSIYKDTCLFSSDCTPIDDRFMITVDTAPNLYAQTILNNYRHLQFDERYNKFFDPNYCESLAQNTVDQWCDLYRPLDHSQCLQKQYISSDVFNWLAAAFNSLKKVNQVKRKEKLSRKKSSLNKDLDSFIVYSDSEETDVEADDYSTTVPSLIIEGPLGCGKTSMIHSIVDDELDGFVFEFNSSQSRARKELEFNLKQIGTTSMLKKSSSYNKDKTVILFDDVDLIDENNGDKDFWPGVTDLLSYSYRPVVFITSDLKKIPTHIVNESTVYKFDKIAKGEVYQYLDMLALSRNLNMDGKILDKLSAMDLRKSLMHLQMLSYYFDMSNEGLTNVTIIKDADNTDTMNGKSNLEKLKHVQHEMDMDYFGKKQDANVISDVFDTCHGDGIHFEIAQEKLYNHGEEANERFETDRNSCLEFYASKYFSNGSRSKMCRYLNGDDYKKKHPANIFYSLPQEKVALDLLGPIRAMAQKEYIRAQNNNPRRFDLHPLDIFDFLHISPTLPL